MWRTLGGLVRPLFVLSAPPATALITNDAAMFSVVTAPVAGYSGVFELLQGGGIVEVREIGLLPREVASDSAAELELEGASGSAKARDKSANQVGEGPLGPG